MSKAKERAVQFYATEQVKEILSAVPRGHMTRFINEAIMQKQDGPPITQKQYEELKHRVAKMEAHFQVYGGGIR